MFEDRRDKLKPIHSINNRKSKDRQNGTTAAMQNSFHVNGKERREAFKGGASEWWLRVNYVVAETTADNRTIEQLFKKYEMSPF